MATSITKGEMVALLDGLPDTTEVVFEDRSAEAHWTFRGVTGKVEDLVLVETTFDGEGVKSIEWERPESIAEYERKTGWKIISDVVVPVVVLT